MLLQIPDGYFADKQQGKENHNKDERKFVFLRGHIANCLGFFHILIPLPCVNNKCLFPE